jgi:hypothetical protein
MNKKLVYACSTVALMGATFAAGYVFAKGEAPKAPTATAVSEMKWTDLMGPGGPSMSVLWGDPMKGGESGFLLKLPAGMVSPPHIHNSDYWAVTISGTPSHYESEHGKEADAKPLPPGSMVMMPAKMHHVSRCAAGAECVMFIRMTGKFDMVPDKTPDKK